MNAIALLIKSHAPDLPYVEELFTSLERFNHEKLPVYLVAPQRELLLFQRFKGQGIEILSDEEVAGDYLVSEGAHGLSAGYLNQEIVKLAFHETGMAQNYFCVDSDTVFIRSFGVRDFLAASGEPYSVLVEDKDLQIEPRYYRDHWQGRERSIRRIMEYVGLETEPVKTCHGHQIFSSSVLTSFNDEFLRPKAWTYANAVLEVPYEFSWYNMWLQKSQVIPIHQIEPLVKVFHNEEQHLDYVLRGISTQDIARAYIGVVINSNYSRDLGPISPTAAKPQLVGDYLSYTELSQVIVSKLSNSVKRRLRHKD